MEYEIVIGEDALNDLYDIYYYIAVNDSFENADKIRNKLINAVLKLNRFPLRGHIVRELTDTYPELLEIISKPFRIMYEIVGKKVIVHSVLDGRRNIQEILSERFLR